ncbi:hypothetical protein GCM10027037_22650 [Mucilaginibacter koreensis]
MKKLLFSLTALSVLFFASCKKDDNQKPGDDTAGAYQPVTNGSTWSYRNTFNAIPDVTAGSVDTTVTTMTAGTEKIGNITYHKLNAVSGGTTETSYLGYNNGIYSAYMSGEMAMEAMDLPYLDEREAAGESWTNQFTVVDEGETIQLQTKTTVAEKGISKTILGKAYSNVIHTTVDVQLKQAGQYNTVMTYDYYIAKNVGVIGIYTKFMGAERFKSELISATIK